MSAATLIAPPPPPQISVVLPVHNGARYLAEAIQSILAQTFRDFELIAVNDGSTDDTAQILSDCAAADSRLRIITNPRNRGIPQTRNIGASAARGEFIAIHDADDRSLPERFAVQLDYLQAHPEIALVGSARYVLSADGALKQNSARLLSKHPVAGAADGKSVHPDFNDLLQTNHFVQGSVMLRKSALDEVGGYNELFACAEDYELWLRIAKRHKLANLRAPLYALRNHAASVTKQNAAQSLLYRHLAGNVAQGKVSDEILAAIKQHGIAAYYPHLAAADKTRYHKSLANTFYRNKKWRDSLREYQALKKLNGADGKTRLRIFLLQVRERVNSIFSTPPIPKVLIQLLCLFVPVSAWRKSIRHRFVEPISRPKRMKLFNKIAKWKIEKVGGIKVATGALPNGATIRLGHIFGKDITPAFAAYDIFYAHEYHFAIQDKAVVIDIGMNVGFASLYFALRDDVDAVYAFEPVEFVYKKALFNFALNKCAEKITASNYGLGDGDKELTINFDDTGSGVATIIPETHGKNKNPITVQVKDAAVEIRNIIAKHPDKKIVMKCDCEGAEKEICERLDAENILPTIDSIVMEYHQNYDRFIEPIFDKHGFSYFKNSSRSDLGIIRAVNNH